MAEAKFTSGPWSIMDGSTPGADVLSGPTIEADGGDWMIAVLDEGNGIDDEDDDIQREAHCKTLANATLIAAAPAMDLMLKLLQSGAARFEPTTGEFCFNGMRYSARDGDWNKVVSVIGWTREVAQPAT